jgi:hypothetical protein
MNLWHSAPRGLLRAAVTRDFGGACPFDNQAMVSAVSNLPCKPILGTHDAHQSQLQHGDF